MVCPDCKGEDPKCFRCDGTGELCDKCGETLDECLCHEDDEDEPCS